MIAGKPYIEEELLGCKFRISARSFFQINPYATRVLYSTALEYAQLTGKETLLDLYCGTGTMGIIGAKKAKEVYGIEIVADAIRDAKINAEANDIHNIHFMNADASDGANQLIASNIKIDAMIVDPPRKGCSKDTLDAIFKIAPERLVYVSCDPATLARDVKIITENGYQLEKVQPCDMFPQTVHVETVVLLSHKKPDGHINVKVEFGEGEGKVPLDNIAKRAESYKPKERVTYKMIKEYIEAKYGFKVHTAYIAEVKRDLGLPMYDAPNAVEELKQPRKHPTAEKVEAIKDALKHFEVI